MKKERIDISKLFSIWMIIVLLMLVIADSSGQRVIVNNNGEKIIMYPDGSWRPVEIRDSLLLRESLQKSEMTDANNGYLPEKNTVVGAEGDEYAQNQWNDLYFEIKAQEKKVQSEFRAATNAKFRANELLENALANKENASSDRLETLKEEYNLSIRRLKASKTNLSAIKHISEMSQQLAGIQGPQRDKMLKKLSAKYNAYLSNYDPGRTVLVANEREIVSPGKKSKSTKSEASTSKVYSGYAKPVSAKQIDEYRSVPVICDVRTDSIDEGTGRRRIELVPALMFTHTDPDLRPYFKNKELITCYGKLLRIDAYVYLSIEFQIASSHSQSNFGSLQSGSLLRMKLLNGEYVSLYSIKSDRGRIDPYSGHTIFTGQYALGKNEIKQLMSSELDKVRILWTTGYEDYDVYKIDFFRDQLDCLMNR